MNRTIKMKYDDPRLDRVPKFFIQMDRTIKPSLEKLMGKDPELRDEMVKTKLELSEKKKSITTRRLLAITYSQLSTDNYMMEVVNLRTLTDMKWEDYGDRYAKDFYFDWIDWAGRIDNPLDVKHKQKLLFTEMKKSHGLKWELAPYKRLPEKEQTYEKLLRVYRRWLKESKDDQRLVIETCHSKEERGWRGRRSRSASE